MPPTVPIDKGFVFVLEQPLEDKELFGEYVKKGCSTLLIPPKPIDGSPRFDELVLWSTDVPKFESKGGKIGAYIGAGPVASEMVESIPGSLVDALRDETHRLVIARVCAGECAALSDFLRRHLDAPDRPHTPWIAIVVPYPPGREPAHVRRSVLADVPMDACLAALIAGNGPGGRRVVGAAVSFCPDTSRVDSVSEFAWDELLRAAGGVATEPGAVAHELCYRVGLSPKYGD